MKFSQQEVEEATERVVEVATWSTTLRDIDLATRAAVDESTGRAFDGVTRKFVNMVTWRGTLRALYEI